jgi:hypothetical protein
MSKQIEIEFTPRPAPSWLARMEALEDRIQRGDVPAFEDYAAEILGERPGTIRRWLKQAEREEALRDR